MKRAVLFAGGKSSRMKQDKALLPFGSYNSLAEYQYQKLNKIFDKVYLSAKSDKFDFDMLLIEDRYEVSSPLVALVSVFESLDLECIFVLSVDAPFVGQNIIDKLYAEVNVLNDVIVARSPFGVEPLCGVYRRTILPHAKALMSEGNHRLKDLLNQVVTQEVFFESEEDFINLNHPDEYQKAYLLSSSI